MHCLLRETVKAVLGQFQKFHIQKQFYVEAEWFGEALRSQVVGIWMHQRGRVSLLGPHSPKVLWDIRMRWSQGCAQLWGHGSPALSYPVFHERASGWLTIASLSTSYRDPLLQQNLSNYTLLRMPNWSLPRVLPTRKNLWMLGSKPKPPGSTWPTPGPGRKTPKGGVLMVGGGSRGGLSCLSSMEAAQPTLLSLPGGVPAHPTANKAYGEHLFQLSHWAEQPLCPRTRHLTTHLCLTHKDIKRTCALG